MALLPPAPPAPTTSAAAAEYAAVLAKAWWDSTDVATYLAMPSQGAARTWMSRWCCRKANRKTCRAWVDAAMAKQAAAFKRRKR